MALTPLSQRVILKVEETKEEKVGSLLLPTAANQNDYIATVLAVATDVKDVAVGDKVIFETGAGLSVEDNGETVIIIKEEHILAILG